MINFVTENGRWILGRWCDEWAKHITNATVSTSAYKDKINIYVNYAVWSGARTKLDICFFTHREKTDEILQKKFDETALACDFCFAQSEPAMQYLDPNKSEIITVGVGEGFVKKEIVLGLPVKEQPFDRKRLSIARGLEQKYPRIKLKFAGGDVDYSHMPYWYEDVDYVLITSDNEGGPMGVLEAIARGKPVIAPYGVGWCDKYPTLKYGTIEELETIIEGLIYDVNSWKIGATQIVNRVNKLLEKK